MTIRLEWTPRLPNSGGTWASRLAEAIGADVASGRLVAGDRLPTQRALARRLGVSTGTVNRGYAIAERAGFVSAEVGRGTFVAAPKDPGIQDASFARAASGAIELGLNYPSSTEADAHLSEALVRLSRESHSGLLGLSPYAGRPSHRAAGARWLRQFGLSVGEEEVLVCTGVQHGLAAALAAVASPGEVVLTESLTSPGLKALAAMHHLRLISVADDDDGLLPDALRSAARTSGARIVYTMPTLHTATTTTMSEDRRRAIAEVIRAERLVAIEDDAWGFLARGSVTPLRTFAPESVIYLNSVSKSIAPGMRCGFVAPPLALRPSISASIGTMTWAAPFMAELLNRWIDDGTAASIMEGRTRLAIERQRLALKLLGSSLKTPALPSFHVWVPLPEPWRVADFVAHAAALGISLVTTDIFVPGRAPIPHAIRVCTGTEANVERVFEGLCIIGRMLASGPSGFSVRVV